MSYHVLSKFGCSNHCSKKESMEKDVCGHPCDDYLAGLGCRCNSYQPAPYDKDEDDGDDEDAPWLDDNYPYEPPTGEPPSEIELMYPDEEGDDEK
jgi:hypothetical protein